VEGESSILKLPEKGDKMGTQNDPAPDITDFPKGRTRFQKRMHPIFRKGAPFKEITNSRNFVWFTCWFTKYFLVL
jgi:hypothetical protein